MRGTAEEAAVMRSEELDSLEAIYGADFVVRPSEELSDGTTIVTLSLHLMALEQEDDTRMDVLVTAVLPRMYPLCLPSLAVDSQGLLSATQSEQLYLRMLSLASDDLGEPVLYTLFVAVLEVLEEQLALKAALLMKSQVAEFRIKGRRWMSLLTGVDPMAHDEERSNDNDNGNDNDKAGEGGEEGEEAKLARALKPGRGEVKHFASDYVALQEIFSQLPPSLAVVKIEAVMRADIRDGFEAYRAQIRKAHPKKEELATSEIVFHGTDTHNVGSIIRTGLVVPGTRGIGIAHGAAYGHGIYLSRTAAYSQGYCGGGADNTAQLFVCAVLSGISSDVRFDGGPNGIIVVKKPEMVLPLYVVHFDWYVDHTRDAYLVMSGAGSILAAKPWAGAGQPGRPGHGGSGGEYSNRLQDSEGSGAELRRDAKEGVQAAAIARASLYVDTKRFKVLAVAEVDDDDDETRFLAADEVRVLHFDEDDETLESLDIHGCTQTPSFQNDRYLPSKLPSTNEAEEAEAEARERTLRRREKEESARKKKKKEDEKALAEERRKNKKKSRKAHSGKSGRKASTVRS